MKGKDEITTFGAALRIKCKVVKEEPCDFNVKGRGSMMFFEGFFRDFRRLPVVLIGDSERIQDIFILEHRRILIILRKMGVCLRYASHVLYCLVLLTIFLLAFLRQSHHLSKIPFSVRRSSTFGDPFESLEIIMSGV